MLIVNKFILFFLELNGYTLPSCFLLYILTRIAITVLLPRARPVGAFALLPVWAWLSVATLFTVSTARVFVIQSDSIAQMRLAGTAPYKLSNGKIFQLPDSPWRIIVINDGSREARIEKVLYCLNGISCPWEGSPSRSRKSERIGAYGMVLVGNSIDYFGPMDRPPQILDVSKGTVEATRYWLTW